MREINNSFSIDLALGSAAGRVVTAFLLALRL
jgi:hypothetical protein